MHKIQGLRTRRKMLQIQGLRKENVAYYKKDRLNYRITIYCEEILLHMFYIDEFSFHIKVPKSYSV